MSIDAFAQRVRRLRAEAGLTLKSLSQRSGVSISALSNIENGKVSPTYERIVALARGLGVDVGYLFKDEIAQPKSRRSVTLSGQGVAHKTPQYIYEALSADITEKDFVPLLATLKAKTLEEFGPLIRHEGEEFMYVLEGEVTIHTDYYSPVILGVGDSCYWDSSMGHACLSTGAVDARVLWVSSNADIDDSD